MVRIYLCLTAGHDPRLLAVAAFICLFASLTSIVTLQRCISPLKSGRRRWLVVAGVATGIGIWATHYAAMLAYEPGVSVRFDPWTALGSALVAIISGVAGWRIGFGGRKWRGALGGLIVGVGLTVTHYLDMSAMMFSGIVVYDYDLIAISIVAGLLPCSLAGSLIALRPGVKFPIIPALPLSGGILALHFIAMSSVTILPGPPSREAVIALDFHQVGALVVLSVMLILTVAFGGAVFDRHLAAETATDKQRLEQLLAALSRSEERYRLAARATDDVIWDWAVGDQRIEWGDAVRTTLGYAEAINGTDLQWWIDRLHPDDRDRTMATMAAQFDGSGDLCTLEYRFLRADGSWADIHAHGFIVRDSDGEAIRSVGAMHDVSERNRTETDLRWAANHDPLTRLPNRAFFAGRLNEALAEATAQGGSVGLVILDIDHFKVLNDTSGHAAGDALLKEIAARLQRDVPSDGLVARLGGDEFAVILPGLGTDIAHALTAQTLLAGLAEPLVVDGRIAEVSISAGSAIWPMDADTATDLLQSADLALYAAKADGRATIRSFRPEMRKGVERRAEMLSHAREALREDRVVPFYQPKVQLATGEVTGFEALLRWHHKSNGLQAPGSISAAFTDRDLAGRLTDEIMERVVCDMRTWLDAGVEFGRIAINGSPADFLRGDLAGRLLGRLERAGIPAWRLELEVTETVFIGQIAEGVARTLAILSDAGVTIALDDFGTGYASLTHLKQFPVDVLKIDQSFVSRLTDRDDDNDAVIVRAVIDLARNLGIATVAEGVETEAQARHLARRGCDLGQGFLFSRAIPAPRVPALVAAGFASYAVEAKPRRATG